MYKRQLVDRRLYCSISSSSKEIWPLALVYRILQYTANIESVFITITYKFITESNQLAMALFSLSLFNSLHKYIEINEIHLLDTHGQLCFD